LRLIWVKEEFSEAAQGLFGAVEGGFEGIEIDLDYLSPRRGAGIREFDREGGKVFWSNFLRINGELVKGKGSVGLAESEGKERVYMVRIIMAVPRVKVLIIVNINLWWRFGRMMSVPPFGLKELEIGVPEGRVGATGQTIKLSKGFEVEDKII